MRCLQVYPSGHLGVLCEELRKITCVIPPQLLEHGLATALSALSHIRWKYQGGGGPNGDRMAYMIANMSKVWLEEATYEGCDGTTVESTRCGRRARCPCRRRFT